MKVKVRFAKPLIMVKREAYEAEQAEFEKLFQENKDLRLEESHLRDEVRFWKKAANENSELAAQNIKELESLKKKFSDTCADRDNLEAAYKEVQASIIKIVHNFNETRVELEREVKRVCEEKQELYAQLADKNEEIEALQRVAAENEKRKDDITELRDENSNLRLKLEETSAELVKHEFNHYKDEAEEWKMVADTITDKYRELQAQFADLQIQHQELGEDYDALVKTKCDYAEEISRLREENKRLRKAVAPDEFIRRVVELMSREIVNSDMTHDLTAFPDSKWNK